MKKKKKLWKNVHLVLKFIKKITIIRKKTKKKYFLT
jgi:hypothetical protein